MLTPRADDYELAGNAVVVRGGTMQILDVAFAVEKCRTEHGVLGLSVYAGQLQSLEDLCATASLPHPQVRATTLDRLASSVPGVVLLPTFRAPHYTLVLPDSESETVWAVCHAFDPPVPNPAQRRRR
ncbi:MAG: hypothetical protein ACYC1D_16605 [Acidimicrobiales bacterium]